MPVRLAGSEVIVYILHFNGVPRVFFTTDFGYGYYMKPITEKMWSVHTLGM